MAKRIGTTVEELKRLQTEFPSKATRTSSIRKGRGGKDVKRIETTFDAQDFFSEILGDALKNIDENNPDLANKVARYLRQFTGFTKTEQELMESHVRARIFKHGLGNTSAGSKSGVYGGNEYQMAPVNSNYYKRPEYAAARAAGFKYRYKTGRLYRSVTARIQPGSLKLIIKFQRERVVIDSLIRKYGNFFKPTETDVVLFQWIILRKLGLLEGQTSRLKPKGVTPPAHTERSKVSAKDIRSFLRKT